MRTLLAIISLSLCFSLSFAGSIIVDVYQTNTCTAPPAVSNTMPDPFCIPVPNNPGFYAKGSCAVNGDFNAGGCADAACTQCVPGVIPMGTCYYDNMTQTYTKYTCSANPVPGPPPGPPPNTDGNSLQVAMVLICGAVASVLSF